MSRINRLLVANRAEIASRVFATCRRLGIETVAVCSDADAELPYVGEADLVVRLPGNTPTETYLRGDLVLAAARKVGADAIHPGYGFLSENADFARSVEDAGIAWVGPSPESIVAMGSKIEAKRIMKSAGVPVLEAPETPTEADLPLLIKASAGGGGRGMRIVRSLDALAKEIEAAQAEAASSFGDGTVFIEPYVENGRHIEVQLMSTTVVGDRDCSVQRRHQKVIEEAPAPGLSDRVRSQLHAAARKAADAIDYRGAGTVEFLYDADKESFYFLETNTRLQVEHPVTEEVTGRDLVAEQIAVAEQADIPSLGTPGDVHGHAIEARLYAEDPADGYLPQTGTLTRFEFPPGVRVDAGFTSGSVVSPFYDAMLAKVIVHGATRVEATRKLVDALRKARIHGLRTNREQLIAILTTDEWAEVTMHTGWLDTDPELVSPTEPDPWPRVAAALALTEADRAAVTVQQRIPAGWRNVVSQPLRVEFTDDTHVEFHGTRDGYSVDGAEVTFASPDRVVIQIDGVQHGFEVAVAADAVDVDGPRGHTALRRKPRFVDPTTQTEPGSLTAAMPGSVTSVMVEAGAEVIEGQPILVMEAMKMQHTITAPMDGVVDSVTVSVGSQVAAGDVLAHVLARTDEPEES
ncbi:MAG: biotin carboxylase N-terminal domain-containing protein [Nocardioides sp.]